MAENLLFSIFSSHQLPAGTQDALVAKDAPLTLCTWRMEQRERRPLKEQVRDNVEVCLEVRRNSFHRLLHCLTWPRNIVDFLSMLMPTKVEKATLIDAQRKLKDFIKKTKATIHALESDLINYDFLDVRRFLTPRLWRHSKCTALLFEGRT